MLMDEPRLTEIQALVEPILTDREMELVELTTRPHGGQQLIRLLVDRIGGVTVEQCAQVNRRIGEALETANLIEGSYTVEVSSPGLDRPLISKRDFERALGEDVVLTASDENRTKEWQGMLLAFQHGAIVLKTGGGNVTVPWERVRMAKKALRW